MSLIYPKKFEGQTYYGAPVMASKKSGLQAKIKEKYGNVEFFYCKAHQINIMIKNSIRVNSFVSSFFEEISEMGWFLLNLLKINQNLKNIPRTIKTRWNYSSRIIKDVFFNNEKLAKFFAEISINKQFKLDSRIKSRHFHEFINKPSRIRILEFRWSIFSNIERSFILLQAEKISVSGAMKVIKHLNSEIKKSNKNFQEIKDEYKTYDFNSFFSYLQN